MNCERQDLGNFRITGSSSSGPGDDSCLATRRHFRIPLQTLRDTGRNPKKVSFAAQVPRSGVVY